jgi:hypothetical protein
VCIISNQNSKLKGVRKESKKRRESFVLTIAQKIIYGIKSIKEEAQEQE